MFFWKVLERTVSQVLCGLKKAKSVAFAQVSSLLTSWRDAVIYKYVELYSKLSWDTRSPPATGWIHLNYTYGLFGVIDEQPAGKLPPGAQHLQDSPFTNVTNGL